LCSDGFWENVAPSEMAAVLAEPDLEQALAGQVDLAAERGGLQADNVTAAAWRRVPGDSG
jgi:serine/threonine protein phosphatase PrpC